jgi:hypothetical protein
LVYALLNNEITLVAATVELAAVGIVAAGFAENVTLSK